jgi:hypothetical protein
MGKAKFFFIALVTVAAFSLDAHAGPLFAMGANGGPFAPEGKRGVEEPKGKGDRKMNGKSEEGSPAGGDEKGKTEKPFPNKKPRLKYRDPYDCSC